MRKGYIPIRERRRVKFNQLNQIKGLMKDSYGKQHERGNQGEISGSRKRVVHSGLVDLGRPVYQELDTVSNILGTNLECRG